MIFKFDKLFYIMKLDYKKLYFNFYFKSCQIGEQSNFCRLLLGAMLGHISESIRSDLQNKTHILP